jgi:hypothetical protein
MRKWLSVTAGALLAASVFGASDAIAAPMSVDRSIAAPDLTLKQDVQYYFGGRQYCFYPNGWRGPGYYWCGYNWRRGYGWGGPMGWRGWGRPAPRLYDRPRPRYEMRREPRREFRRGF